jgi:hypothetical protein
LLADCSPSLIYRYEKMMETFDNIDPERKYI